MRLSLHYDNQFLKHVGKNNHTNAIHKIREMINLAGPMFQAKPWKLGHNIELVEQQITWVDEILTLNKKDDAIATM